MHEPLLQVCAGVLFVQFVEFVQVPPLHVCTVLPEHWTWPGEHEPLHEPLEQVELMHAVVIPHCPVVGSHCCTPLPLQRVCPGAHIPVHTPPRHV